MPDTKRYIKVTWRREESQVVSADELRDLLRMPEAPITDLIARLESPGIERALEVWFALHGGERSSTFDAWPV